MAKKLAGQTFVVTGTLEGYTDNSFLSFSKFLLKTFIFLKL